MDEMAISFQEVAARAQERVETARTRGRGILQIDAQHDRAHAFLQQWIWRFGNVTDLEAC